MTNNPITLSSVDGNQKYKVINYNFFSWKLIFSSLINPNTIKHNRLTLNKNKIFLKKSYTLITWLFYIENKLVKYFILPKKLKKFTFTKSPMAHKTFSQEQFQFKSYKIITSYKLRTNTYLRINSYSASLQFILNIRSNLTRSLIGTNLLFMKRSNLRFTFYEKAYFKVI